MEKGAYCCAWNSLSGRDKRLSTRDRKDTLCLNQLNYYIDVEYTCIERRRRLAIRFIERKKTGQEFGPPPGQDDCTYFMRTTLPPAFEEPGVDDHRDAPGRQWWGWNGGRVDCCWIQLLVNSRTWFHVKDAVGPGGDYTGWIGGENFNESMFQFYLTYWA